MNDVADAGFHPAGLTDEELAQEIRLVTDLMLLASETSTPLPQTTIDHALGVPHP